MSTIIAWRQMVANFPNLKGLNAQHYQSVQIRQPLTATRLRIWLTNDYGDAPLPIKSLVVTGQQTVSVTVSGQTSFQIPAQSRLWSDWLELPVTAGEWLQFETTSPCDSPQTLAQSLDETIVRVTSASRPYFFGLAAIEVEREGSAQSLLMFGDSLTNQGYYSAAFSRRLLTSQPNQWGLTNGGISGNRLLRPGHSTSEWSPSFGAAGLDRLPRLLTEQPVNWLIFMEGLNDLLHPGNGSPITELPHAAELIAGLKQVQQLAQAQHCRLTLMTITPFKGGLNGGSPAWNPAKEQIRQTVNRYLRSLPLTVDLAQFVATADQRLAPDFDCGDHIHFSAAGGELVGRFLTEQLQLNQ